jgi:DNA-binding FadR family transcriptional regulator
LLDAQGRRVVLGWAMERRDEAAQHSMAKHEMLLQMWTAIEANVRRGIFYGNIIYQIYSPNELLHSHHRILEAVAARDVQVAKR